MPTIFEINATLPIFVASFLIFIALLNKIMLQPIGKVLEQRAEKIKHDIEEGKTQRTKAETLLNQYQKHLHEYRVKAQTTINEAAEKANYHRNLAITQVKEEGENKLKEAKSVIASQRAMAIEAMLEQEAKLVEGITERVLGEPVAIKVEPNAIRLALEEAS